MATIGSVIPTLGTSTRVGTHPVPGVAAIDVGRLLSFGFGTTVDVLEELVEPVLPGVTVAVGVAGAEPDPVDVGALLVPVDV